VNKNFRDLYRGINECKKGYQPTTNSVIGENDNLLAESYNMLNRWMNYFCQLLNICGMNDVRQIEMLTVDPLVEIAVEKLKRCKSPGTDQIPAELNQGGGNTLHS
jgi:hypothetical protein